MSTSEDNDSMATKSVLQAQIRILKTFVELVVDAVFHEVHHNRDVPDPARQSGEPKP